MIVSILGVLERIFCLLEHFAIKSLSIVRQIYPLFVSALLFLRFLFSLQWICAREVWRALNGSLCCACYADKCELSREQKTILVQPPHETKENNCNLVSFIPSQAKMPPSLPRSASIHNVIKTSSEWNKNGTDCDSRTKEQSENERNSNGKLSLFFLNIFTAWSL